jgi:hypothetical protein
MAPFVERTNIFVGVLTCFFLISCARVQHFILVRTCSKSYKKVILKTEENIVYYNLIFVHEHFWLITFLVNF